MIQRGSMVKAKDTTQDSVQGDYLDSHPSVPMTEQRLLAVEMPRKQKGKVGV